MKILLLAPHPFYSNRGTPIAGKLVCEGLVNLGHSVDVLTYHEGEPVEIAGVTVHRIRRPLFVRHVGIGPTWQKILCDVSMVRELRRMLRAQRYDLIHAVEESAFMAARTGLPFVFDMDSHMSAQILEKSVLFWPAAKLVQMLERDALRRSEGVLAVCQVLVDEAKKYQPNAHLLPDPAFNGYGKVPESITSAHGTRLMYVGNLEQYQGIDLMLDAYARVARERRDVVLLVIGGKAEHIATYRGKAAALGVADRVTFTGPLPVESLGAMLEYADVLLSPRIDGINTPMKLYSYLLSGKPVLATRTVTHTQAVTDEHVLLVAPNASAMAAGMRQLVDAPELRARLGAAGRELATRNYTLPAFFERLGTFYQRFAS
jgi:glycosyltransferase involved in cell wall biosynthesis